jgi:hypothetical protein
MSLAMVAETRSRQFRDNIARKAAELKYSKVVGIDPAPYYPQMWFWDLVAMPPKLIEPTIRNIQTVVGIHYGITLHEINSARRIKPLILPRAIAAYLARHFNKMSYQQIGDRFGGRDHSTICHLCTKLEGLMEVDADLVNLVENFKARFQPVTP